MTLTEKYNSLQIEKMKLDKFFSMFLEKFERKMDSDAPDTPVWKLYKSKLKDYQKINQEIKNTQYWLSKENNVRYI